MSDLSGHFLFLLIGTCGAYWNALLAGVYIHSLRSRPFSYRELRRALIFVGAFEFGYSLFLLNENLLGTIAVVAASAAQFATLKASSQPEIIPVQIMRTYLPNSEGPRAVGRVLALFALGTVFLLCLTPLREMSIWHKLLFTVPTPISAYLSFSLLAASRTRSN